MVKVPYLFLKGYHVDKSASLRKRKYGSSKEEQDQKKKMKVKDMKQDLFISLPGYSFLVN